MGLIYEAVILAASLSNRGFPWLPFAAPPYQIFFFPAPT